MDVKRLKDTDIIYRPPSLGGCRSSIILCPVFNGRGVSDTNGGLKT